MCGYGDVAVDVASEIDFDNVSCFEWFLVVIVEEVLRVKREESMCVCERGCYSVGYVGMLSVFDKNTVYSLHFHSNQSNKNQRKPKQTFTHKYNNQPNLYTHKNKNVYGLTVSSLTSGE